jgi:hypothetical protein
VKDGLAVCEDSQGLDPTTAPAKSKGGAARKRPRPHPTSLNQDRTDP